MTGDVQQWIGNVEYLQNIIAGLLDDRSPGVICLVHPVPESGKHEGVGFIFGLVNVFFKVVAIGMDGFQHMDNRFIGTAMQWSPQCVDTSGDGGIQVASGTAYQADGGG